MNFIKIIALVTFLFSATGHTSESHSEIQLLAQLNQYFNPRVLPTGYEGIEIDTPEFKSRLKAYFRKLNHEKRSQWKNYVYNSIEFEHLSPSERRRIANNPKEELEVQYLIEIERVWLVKKDGRNIGYVFETTDHVQAEIYQDGAGIYIFFEMNFELAFELKWSA